MPASVKDDYAKAIGRAIAEARSERGMTQRDLQRAVGNSKTAVSNWERGVSAPTVQNLRELCKVLKVTPQRLLIMSEPGARTKSGGHGATARDLASQLAELRHAAQEVVPDLMKALGDAEKKARSLAGDET